MGGCCSSSSSAGRAPPPPTANVISLNGNLMEYRLPVTVSQVLMEARAEASSSSSLSDVFVCNSDGLYYDQPMLAMDSDTQLHPSFIYFVMPASKLKRPLSASDMAALAVKASVAMQNADNGSRRKKARISPVLFANQNNNNNSNYYSAVDYKDSASGVHVDNQRPQDYDYDITIGRGGRPSVYKSSSGISRSGSVKRLQRFTSRRAKLAVRSFRLRLSTIYEGTVL